MTFVIDLVAMVLARPRALMPAIGAVMIGGGEATVGVLLASTAVGAFLAGLFSRPWRPSAWWCCSPGVHRTATRGTLPPRQPFP